MSFALGVLIYNKLKSLRVMALLAKWFIELFPNNTENSRKHIQIDPYIGNNFSCILIGY